MSRDGSVETWSKLVTDASNLPARVACAVTEAFKTFPYCVWAPAAAIGLERSRPTYLCLGEGEIGILRDGGRKVNSMVISLNDIDEVETGAELLQSWIAFHYSGRRDAVYFNSVGSPLYQQVAAAYRAAREKSFVAHTGIDGYFDALRRLDFKYSTYPRSVLGARLPSASFYHPTREIERGFFAPRAISSYYLVFAAGLLYSFSEERIVRSTRVANYSMVVRYIPIEGRLTLAPPEEKPGYSWQRLVRTKAPLFRIPVVDALRPQFLSFCMDIGIDPGTQTAKASA